MGIRVAFISGPEEHLGLEYLSAALKENGHNVEIFVDPQLFMDEVIALKSLARLFNAKKRLIREVVGFQPQLIGFSVTSDFFLWANEIAKQLKKQYRCPIIFGGIHPTSMPEEVLASDAVDMVCVGEGDAAIVEVADSIAKNNKRDDIENIWFKNEKHIRRNPLRAPVNIDSLPHPDHSLYYKKYRFFKPGYHTIASRGCLMHCSYCCHSLLKELYGGKWYYRMRSVPRLIEELKEAKKAYQIKVVRFCDDIFPYNERWLEEFAKLYASKVSIPFICYYHPELVSDRRMELLHKSGCVEVRLGIQSLSPQIRHDVLDRKESNETIEKSMYILRRYRLRIVTENILGLPNQSNEDLIDMVRFYNRMRPDRNHFFWLRYYPNTIITRRYGLFKNQLSAEKSEIFTRGGDTYYGELNKKLVLLLYLLPFLSRKVIDFILLHRLWNILPNISLLSLLNALSSLSSSSYSDRIQRGRFCRRYGQNAKICFLK